MICEQVAAVREDDGYIKNALYENESLCNEDISDIEFSSVTFSNCTFVYSNFSQSRWEDCIIKDSSLKGMRLSESVLKKLALHGNDMTGADFFKTPLRNIDLSDCILNGFSVSDTLYELRGAKISPEQAIILASMLGVKIV